MEEHPKFDENFVLNQINQIENLNKIVNSLNLKIEEVVEDKRILKIKFSRMDQQLRKLRRSEVSSKRRIKKLRRRTRYLENYIKEAWESSSEDSPESILGENFSVGEKL